MSRERLTSKSAEWLKSKPGTQVSDKGTGIDNDPYNMNDTGHEKNDPKVEQYAKGDPSAWAEDQAAQNWASQNKGGEKRDDSNVATLIDKHAAAQAVASAKRLEEKAVKCIIAAQRILPGAAEEMIEKQAAIFMHLPEEGLNATLANQEDLAKQIAKQAGDVAEEAKAEGESEEQEKKEKEVAEEKKEEKEDTEDKKKAASELAEKQAKLEALKKQASEIEKEITAMDQNAKANKNWPTGKKDKTEKKAGEEEDKKEEKEDKKDEGEDKAAAMDKKEEDKKEDDDKKEDKAAAVKEEEKKEEEKKEDDKKEATEIEASDGTLLDQIFGEVTASETKKGAAKLSGMVKKEASEQVNDLTGLWASAPDVRNMF